MTKLDEAAERAGPEAVAELAELRGRLASMLDFLEWQCRCPCCDEQLQCVADCTFATDCPKEHLQMLAVRGAVYWPTFAASTPNK